MTQRHPRALASAGIGMAILAFALESALVVRGATRSGDRALALDVHRTLPLALHRPMVDVSAVGQIGPVAVVGAVIAVALWALRRQLTSAILVVGPLVATAVEVTLKQVFRRPRPHLWPGALHGLGYSFPSGHATSSAAFATALILVTRQGLNPITRASVAVLAILFAAVVGLSRVYLGVHWPTDIFGGYLVGATATTTTWSAMTAIVRRSPPAPREAHNKKRRGDESHLRL